MWILFSPFVPSVHHPLSFAVYWSYLYWSSPFLLLFLFSTKYARVGWISLSGGFSPAYLLLCPARFRFLAFEGNGSARSPVNSVRSLSMVGAFRAGLTSISQHSLTQRILSTTPWLCHFEVFWLSFAFFPESCVVHVDDAGLNHRPMLGSKVCAKMPGLPALGSKNCLVSSPGTLFHFFGFSYCHLWQWQLTL